MQIKKKLTKRLFSLLLILFLCIENFAAVVSDNDGSAFITKAEFDSLKNDFQTQIDQYNTSIDNKIDGAIAAYLAGVKVDNKSVWDFPLGAGEKVVICTSNSITNMTYKKAKLDFSFDIANFYDGGSETVSDYANNEGGGIIKMTRAGERGYELFNLNSTGTKFAYYSNNALLDLTGSWNYIRTGNYNGTQSVDGSAIAWHATPWQAKTLNRSSAAVTGNYYDDRFNRESFATIYGRKLNWGNTWGGSQVSSSVTTSVKIDVADSDKILWIFDNASANSKNWVWDPEVNKDRVCASPQGLYSTTSQQYNAPNNAGITTSGSIYFRTYYYKTSGWKAAQKTVNMSTWTTTGNYDGTDTSGNVTAGKWIEFHLAPGKNSSASAASDDFQDPSLIINGNISSNSLNAYSPYGYTGAVTEGLPIGIFKGQGSIEFEINTTPLNMSSVFCVATSPFKPKSQTIDDISNVPGISNIKIDGVSKSSAANVLTNANHTIKFDYDFNNNTAIFYKIAIPKNASASNKALRKIMTLPSQYTLTKSD